MGHDITTLHGARLQLRGRCLHSKHVHCIIISNSKACNFRIVVRPSCLRTTKHMSVRNAPPTHVPCTHFLRLIRPKIPTTRRRCSGFIIVCKVQVRVITQLPRLDQMCGSEHRTEQKTQSTNDQIRNTKEIVLATNDRPCGNEDLLRPAILCDWKVCASSILVTCPRVQAVWKNIQS